MTDLLKNKKLLNENITEFIYNNEAFSNELTNLITLFKNRYIHKNLNILDKVVIYQFYKDIKGNINLSKIIINDFIKLIKLLNDKKKEGNNNENIITEQSKIYEVVDKSKNFSDIFIKKFENNDGLTIDKTNSIFEYYLKLIYEDVKNEIKKYQEELDNKSIEKLNNYYKEKHLITKKDFAYAIRLFITLVLLPEEDKINKIKSNRNNLVNYLKSSDLWNKEIYDNDGFNKNLNDLKKINFHINQIIYLYEVLVKDIEDNFLEDVEEEIRKEKNDNNGPLHGNRSDSDNDDVLL